MNKSDAVEVPSDFASILEGGHFTFIVGPEKRRFVVHSALVSKHSKPLASMMSSGMTESASGTVTLDDVDSATFVQFAEYLYSGRYTTIPVETYAEKQERIFAEKCANILQNYVKKHGHDIPFYCLGCQQLQLGILGHGSENYPYHNNSCKSKKQGCTPKCTLCQVLIADHEALCKKCESELFGSTADEVLPECRSQFRMKRIGVTGVEDRATSQVSQGFETATNDLSAHARVWVLADRYQVPGLQQLSLRRLHHDVVAYQLDLEAVKEIVDLIEYVYENTFTPEPETNAVGEVIRKSCELRDLVMEYAACQADMLVETKAFCIMLQGGGDLASDFAKALVKRGD